MPVACRGIQIRASESPSDVDLLSKTLDSTDPAGKFYSQSHSVAKTRRLNTKIFLTDARFEVIGAPYSLLSVSLSASQTLYTRRGTLVGVSGKSENVSMLEVKG